MNTEDDDRPEWCKGTTAAGPGNKDIIVQLVISFALGISAFIGFCFIRPRWKTLYSARKRHSDPNIALPRLPDSFFGWMPALYRVTEEQILASAGLDAFVFLSFFKMSLRLFSTIFFFAAVVLWPIHETFDPGRPLSPPIDNSTDSNLNMLHRLRPRESYGAASFSDGNGSYKERNWGYLWAYLAFTWLFSFLTVYFMNSETLKIISLRQDYLGTQSTITDRTFRLTGIPVDIRSEEKIKEFVENLEIGHVRSVTLCQDWAQVDSLVAKRKRMLQGLEESWTAYLAQKPTTGRGLSIQQRLSSDNEGQGDNNSEQDDVEENGRLLDGDNLQNINAERVRPKVRLRYGFLKIRSRKVDALDYYEEKLRRLDGKILEARKKTYKPTDTAFVTMDSIAACQMAIQATVDPRPGQLLTKPAPSPSDVVWTNTYAPRYRRRLQSWTVTVFITILSILWLFPVALLAQLLSICNISQVAPSLAESLQRHDITKALVQTGLPTLVVSLLNVLVPFLYDYLSNAQGTISQGDVELSSISKNFFFVFFNIFVVYAVSGSAALFEFWAVIKSGLSDSSQLAMKLAESIQELSNFYINFIMLQGVGLFPFRLLQFGSVSTYPLYRMWAKTPRDFAELSRPALFNYGFYLPTALLVFILCLVYSILPHSHIVLLLGLCYFGLGYFVYKYQLLYAMDQPQHATGGAWPMICRRIILGLIVFQVVMIAILVLRLAFWSAGLIVPLMVLTLWYHVYFQRRYTPLTKFIALRSIKRESDPGVESHPDHDVEDRGVGRQTLLTRRMSTIDEDREKGMRFVNPSLFDPLPQPWIYRDPPVALSPEESMDASTGIASISGDDLQERTPETSHTPQSEASSFSLGDTHVWRENGEDNV